MASSYSNRILVITLALTLFACGYTASPRGLEARGTDAGVVAVDANAPQASPAPASTFLGQPVRAANYPFAYPVGPAGGGLSGTYPNPTVVASGVTPGTVGQFYTTQPGPIAGWSTITGDVSASVVTAGLETVVKVNGATVPAAGALTTGNTLGVTGVSTLAYSPLNLAGGAGYVSGVLPAGNLPNLTFTGDVTGTGAIGTIGLTDVKINGASVPAAGALVTGNGLYVTGASALSYSALNLAGGTNFVTGDLPVANGGTGAGTFTAHGVLVGEGTSAVTATAAGTAGQMLLGQGATSDPAYETMSGDTSLTSTGVCTVSKINGSSVPAGGSLTTGNVLQVSGAAALSYSPVNLAGGANFVTGQLPVANIANGTSAQFLDTNSGATSAQWVSISGDESVTSAGVVTNTAIQGVSLSSANANTLKSIQTGTVALTAGGGGQGSVSSVTLTSSSVIMLSVHTVTGTITTTASYQAPAANRVVGSGTGSFIAFAVTNSNTVDTSDHSTLDWLIVN